MAVFIQKYPVVDSGRGSLLRSLSLALWSVGQLIFPSQANGSLIIGDNGKAVGSRLIAQPFTRDEYFYPQPAGGVL